ncbi:MAG: phage portal protein [Chloroflexota bacterium]
MPVLTETIRRIRRSGENPTLTERGSFPWPWSAPSLTGVSVTDESALTLSAFHRGVTLIASGAGGLPLHILHKRPDGISERVETDDTKYLWLQPNPEMVRQTFWERVFADEVRGNAFIWVEKDDLSRPLHLWWIARQRVQVGRTSAGLKVYQLDNDLPMIDYKAGGEIVHIPNWGDSLSGYDIVKLAANAIALGLSAEEYAARTFSDGAVPPGILSSALPLTPVQADEIASRWHSQHGGLRNRLKIAVLGHGATFQQLSANPEQMQLEPLRKYQAGDIATLLGIAPHMLGLVDKTTSWGTGIAEMGQGFVTYTLNAHIGRVRQAIDSSLLVRELTGRYVEFDPGGLLRGSIQQQYAAHDQGIKGGFVAPNDARRDLDMPPVEGGEDLLFPLNMGTTRDRDLARVKTQSQAAATLIRAGFEPLASLDAVGLPPIEHTGRLPSGAEPRSRFSRRLP